MNGEGGSEKALRLDKWLWYARFFKTRANASKAISGGRFRLDGVVTLADVKTIWQRLEEVGEKCLMEDIHSCGIDDDGQTMP